MRRWIEDASSVRRGDRIDPADIPVGPTVDDVDALVFRIAENHHGARRAVEFANGRGHGHDLETVRPFGDHGGKRFLFVILEHVEWQGIADIDEIPFTDAVEMMTSLMPRLPLFVASQAPLDAVRRLVEAHIGLVRHRLDLQGYARGEKQRAIGAVSRSFWSYRDMAGWTTRVVFGGDPIDPSLHMRTQGITNREIFSRNTQGHSTTSGLENDHDARRSGAPDGQGKDRARDKSMFVSAGRNPWRLNGGPKTALRGSDINFFDVVHDDAIHRVQIKRVATARRLTLRVRAASRDVVLTLPSGGSLAQAKLFVDRHAAWIGTRLARLPAPTPFGPGAMIPLRGVPHEITHRPVARGTVWLEAVTEPDAYPRLCVSGEAAFVSRRVRDFLMREARRDLVEAVSRHTATLGVVARRMTLRDTTTRWGSCSSVGALNFSWRLIMAPPFVLDYLAAHEVAHLVHMNHSTAFWAVTKRLIPEMDRAEAWLKAHGVGLMRFGGAPKA